MYIDYALTILKLVLSQLSLQQASAKHVNSESFLFQNPLDG